MVMSAWQRSSAYSPPEAIRFLQQLHSVRVDRYNNSHTAVAPQVMSNTNHGCSLAGLLQLSFPIVLRKDDAILPPIVPYLTSAVAYVDANASEHVRA